LVRRGQSWPDPLAEQVARIDIHRSEGHGCCRYKRSPADTVKRFDRDNKRTFVRSLPTGAFKQPETHVISRLAKLKLEAIVVEAWIKCERLSPKFPPFFSPTFDHPEP
jgi:hypothetical protein